MVNGLENGTRGYIAQGPRYDPSQKAPESFKNPFSPGAHASSYPLSARFKGFSASVSERTYSPSAEAQSFVLEVSACPDRSFVSSNLLLSTFQLFLFG